MGNYQQFAAHGTQETELNKKYSIGMRINVTSELIQGVITGTLLKKYTNSCLIDFSDATQISQQERTKYNHRLIVRYLDCQLITKEVQQ